MYNKDWNRLKYKIYHKIRWLYSSRIQEKKRNLIAYRSYRKLLRLSSKETKVKYCNQYMTKIVNPSAGIGDQLASWITGYYYAKIFNLHYAYTPVFPQKWNSFLGFQVHEITVKELQKKGYKKVWLPCFNDKDEKDLQLMRSIIHVYSGSKIIFFLELHQVYTEQYGVMEQIQNKFYAAQSRINEKVVYDTDYINIAIHIRRGDIVEGQNSDNSSLTFRWLNTDYYINVLDCISKNLNMDRVRLYIFSQGEESEFREFDKFKNVNWCLHMTAIESFLHMVKADILITSKSSFSYKPALLSKGIKICPRYFWHGYPKEDSWILVNDNGEMEEKRLCVLKELETKNRETGTLWKKR